MNTILVILIISVIGPIIGSLIGVLKKPTPAIMYPMLSFAAGVMLSISFLNLLPLSIKYSSVLVCAVGITAGAVVMYILDRIIPHIHPELCSNEQGSSLKRVAIYLIFGIFMHNFPEGMAVATGVIANSKVSITIALAIAIHNIPEGICTSAPYYYCNKKRLRSFLISSLTALPVIAGFVLTYYLYQFIPHQLIGLLIGATAGLMIYISSDELIPNSCGKTQSHSTIFSLIAGVLLVVLLGLI